MKKLLIALAVILVLGAGAVGAMFITGTGLFAGQLAAPEAPTAPSTAPQSGMGGTVQFADPVDINDVHLRDVDSLYEGDPYDVVTMYLTVREGNAADGTDHTWEEVNTYSAYYYDDLGIDRYKVAGLLQVGDENGPVEGELGYGLTVPNATVQIRGQTSSRNAQKNYKIELMQDSGEWNSQRTIALNKHQTDGLRFRNKLAYDLMSGIPQIMALRTQFVHLYVRDMTGDTPDEFQDYGLYTQVEQLNKTALRAHGLDKNGYLYKVNFFEFRPYEELKLVTDPDYDEKAFSFYLEPKTRSDHEKLLDMIDKVNDYSIPPDELLDTYFDRENIAYWMAFMLLMRNDDTQSRNMYLYSPLNSNTWYIIPWDNDDMMRGTEQRLRGHSDEMTWEYGISNYWGNMLFRRALMSADFRKDLDDAIHDLLENYLSEERLKEIVPLYSDVITPYLYRMPDSMRAPLKPNEYEEVVNSLPYGVWDNYERYLETLDSPMPFFVEVPVNHGNSLSVNWEMSASLNEEDITYHVTLSRDYLNQDVLYEADGLRLSQISIPVALEPGQYFFHVYAVNESGHAMACFDYYKTNKGKVYGTYSFFVNQDGSISIYESAFE